MAWVTTRDGFRFQTQHIVVYRAVDYGDGGSASWLALDVPDGNGGMVDFVIAETLEELDGLIEAALGGGA